MCQGTPSYWVCSPAELVDLEPSEVARTAELAFAEVAPPVQTEPTASEPPFDPAVPAAPVAPTAEPGSTALVQPERLARQVQRLAERKSLGKQGAGPMSDWWQPTVPRSDKPSRVPEPLIREWPELASSS